MITSRDADDTHVIHETKWHNRSITEVVCVFHTDECSAWHMDVSEGVSADPGLQFGDGKGSIRMVLHGPRVDICYLSDSSLRFEQIKWPASACFFPLLDD